MGMRGWWLRLRSLVARETVERELDDEVRFHLDMETDANVRHGMAPEEARREALRRFGGVERHKEDARDTRGTRPLEDLVRDVSFALRGLRRSPGFAGAVLLTLALGIGGTTAVYSVVQGVLLRPLPFPEADELTTVWMRNVREDIEEDITSWPTFQDWREQSRSFESMVAVRGTSLTVTGDGPAEEIRAAQVSDGFFEMLDAPLHLGRGFLPEETEAGAERVVVLSHELWVRRFGSDPSVVGRDVLLSDLPHTVVGITGPDRRYPRDAEAWTPLVFRPGMEQLQDARGALWLPIMGRLADGVTLQAAQVEMDGIAARLAETYPANEGQGVNLEPLHESLVGDVRTPLTILFGAVVFVLLVACANVGNLLLARGASRTREMAVRLSLGAGRRRLIRQVATESLVLGLAGGILGVGVAVAAVGLLGSVAPADLPRMDEVGLDGGVLVFALALSVGAGFLFSILPALQVARTAPGEHLKEGSRGDTGGAVARLGPVFVASQFALAVVLLVGAGLLVRSFNNVRAVDPGYEPEGVLTVDLRLPSARYPDSESREAFFDALVPRLAALPGVESAGMISSVLLARLPNMGRITVEGRPELEEVAERHSVTQDAATPGAFGALGIEVVRGRLLRDSDGADEAPVAVVNETFVRRFFPDGDPLGGRFVFGSDPGEDTNWITIVGVVEDTRRSGLTEEVRPAAFLPWSGSGYGGGAVVIRTGGDPLTLAQPAREEVRRVDPDLAVARIRTLEQAVSETLAQRRFVTLLLGVFAVMGTLLAAIGIYGVMAYLVGRRTRELGIRLALGAERGVIVGGVLRQALLQASAGLVIGLGGALAMTRLIRSQLFGLEPSDPLTFAAVAALLVGVALTASWIPARRAASVDPAVPLRAE